MALAIHRERRALPWVWILFGSVLFILLVGAGWYTYRWYMYGEPLPLNVPALATADPRVDESEVTNNQITEHTVGAKEPRYISIPELDITKTRIFGAGVDETGALEAPTNISDVVWYTKSGTPGSDAVSLMDGHNGGITRNGVFAKLSTLEKGSMIVIERGDGEIFRYEVRENQSMPLEVVNDTGMKKMMQSAEPGKEALNIITCDGHWVPRLKQFDRRIMLRAVLVD